MNKKWNFLRSNEIRNLRGLMSLFRRQAFKTGCIWINNCPVLHKTDMRRKKTQSCLSWPIKTSKISNRLQNIAILLVERTIMNYWNLILPLSSLFYWMWDHLSLDDLDTQQVSGVAECSPSPLANCNLFGNSNLLRVTDSKYRESLDRFEQSKTLKLCLKNAFSELSLKILFQFSKNLTSSKNSQKTKIHLFISLNMPKISGKLTKFLLFALKQFTILEHGINLAKKFDPCSI